MGPSTTFAIDVSKYVMNDGELSYVYINLVTNTHFHANDNHGAASNLIFANTINFISILQRLFTHVRPIT